MEHQTPPLHPWPECTRCLNEIQRINSDVIRIERDVRHLESDVKEIKTTLDTHGDKLDALKEEISKGLNDLRLELFEKIGEVSKKQIELGVKVGIGIGIGSAIIAVIGQIILKHFGVT